MQDHVTNYDQWTIRESAMCQFEDKSIWGQAPFQCSVSINHRPATVRCWWLYQPTPRVERCGTKIPVSTVANVTKFLISAKSKLLLSCLLYYPNIGGWGRENPRLLLWIFLPWNLALIIPISGGWHKIEKMERRHMHACQVASVISDSIQPYRL